jgi:cytosine deaminase
MIDAGVTAIRTHVDAGAAVGTKFVEVMVALRGEIGELADLQIAAMPDTPLTGRQGAENRAALARAMDAGADVVGGAPWRDPEPHRAVEFLLSFARERALPLDLHTDETVDPEVLTLAHLVGLVAGSSPDVPITVSHCVSLGVQPPDVTVHVVGELAAAGIAVVVCPATNLFLQGRDHVGPQPRGLTAIAPLQAAGVPVAAGGDNLQDFFNPLGSGDPLVTAGLMVWAGHETPERAYDAVSRHARHAMGLPGVEVSPGHVADLLAVRAPDLRSALADPATDRIVFRRGRVVSRTDVHTTRYGSR